MAPHKLAGRDLRRLTPGERWFLWREREGLTAVEAAPRAGVGRTSYWRIEADLIAAPREAPDVEPTSPGERLRLARRRSGLALRRAARLAGVSHVWLLRLEHLGDARLAGFWRGRGFRGL